MFGINRGVKIATNLAIFVYAGKSDKWQNHSLTELTLFVPITA